MHGDLPKDVFLQDLAVVMTVAGLVTVLFHWLRQPVVLGYILAGVIVGPHTKIPLSVHDGQTVGVMSELGMILLMFGLGLHFSLRKLAAVGATAVVAATDRDRLHDGRSATAWGGRSGGGRWTACSSGPSCRSPRPRSS